jgi:hypothetical protein
VDLDITVKHPQEILVERPRDEFEMRGDRHFVFRQEIEYENLPHKCSYCSMLGHLVGVCRFKKRDEASGGSKAGARVSAFRFLAWPVLH